MSLSPQQLQHYSRQIMLSLVGEAGQEKLLHAKVAIVGLGGLGSPVALYLAAAGVGHLTLLDFDQVDESNLQRQIIHRQSALDEYKVDSAAQTIAQLNPSTQITRIKQLCLTAEQFAQHFAGMDVVVDCCDNFDSRYAINQACYDLKIPLVSGAAIRFEGQITVFNFAQSAAPCYACLYPPADGQAETCAQHGVLSPVVGIIGSLQATEALKVLLNLPSLENRLLIYDALSAQPHIIKFSQDPQCPVCSRLSKD